MWKKKERLYKFLMKLLSKSRENFWKKLRKFKKTLRYSLIWKEKNIVELDFKKKSNSAPKLGRNGCSWRAVIFER